MKKIIASIIIGFVVFSGNIAFAVDKTCDSSTKLCNPLQVESIQDVIFLAVDIAIYLGTAFAMLGLIYVGYKFVTAQGDEGAIKEAKTWFFNIVVGLAILISSKVIVEVVKNTLVNTGVVSPGVFSPK